MHITSDDNHYQTDRNPPRYNSCVWCRAMMSGQLPRIDAYSYHHDVPDNAIIVEFNIWHGWIITSIYIFMCVRSSIPSLQRSEYGHMWVPWWRHQMETVSALLAICAGNSPVPGEFPNKGQWRGALMFSLIWARINGWVNNHEAGDLRRHPTHCDVIVMLACQITHRIRWFIHSLISFNIS